MAILSTSEMTKINGIKLEKNFKETFGKTTYDIHLLGLSLRFGDLYIVSLKHVSSNLRSSVRRASICPFLGFVWANPTPASQIYSQLSIFANSSALSGPAFFVAVTVKSGQNNRSCKSRKRRKLMFQHIKTIDDVIDENGKNCIHGGNKNRLLKDCIDNQKFLHIKHSRGFGLDFAELMCHHLLLRLMWKVVKTRKTLSTHCLRICKVKFELGAAHNLAQLVVLFESCNCCPQLELIFRLICILKCSSLMGFHF